MNTPRVAAASTVVALAAAAKSLAGLASPELGAIIEDAGKGGLAALAAIVVVLVTGLRRDVQALGDRINALERPRPRARRRRRRAPPQQSA